MSSSTSTADDEDRDVDSDEEEEESFEESPRESLVSAELERRFLLVEKDLFGAAPAQLAVSESNAFRRSLLKREGVANTHTGTHAHRRSSTLCQAEVDALSLLRLLARLFAEYRLDAGSNSSSSESDKEEEARFVDLGCGAGKTLLAAALLNRFRRVTGVEIAPGLLRRAQEAMRRFDTHWRTPADRCETELLLGDGTRVDWAGASLVYAQATLFDEEMMARINTQANALAPGAVLILVNNRLPEDYLFDLVEITSIESNYGPMSVFVYRRNLLGQRPSAEELRRRFESVLARKYVVPSYAVF